MDSYASVRTYEHMKVSITCISFFRWHAKRFHMLTIEDEWVVPLTSNAKNIRATYRAVCQGVYMEDLSYWRCIEVEGLDEEAKGKVIASGVTYDSVAKAIAQHEETSCWLVDENDVGLARATFIRDNSQSVTWFWCHPSSTLRLRSYFEKRARRVELKEDLSFFRLIGPQAKDKLHVEGQRDVYKTEISSWPCSDMTSQDQVMIIATPGCSSDTAANFGAGYDVVMPKQFSYNAWLNLVRSGVVIGCLDSQERLDVELERLTAEKLSPDLGVSSFYKERSLIQQCLHVLAKQWSNQEKPPIRIVRDTKTLSACKTALEAKEPQIFCQLKRQFLPVVVCTYLTLIQTFDVTSTLSLCR